MASPTLTLQLSDKTLKKLRALAMLSGSTVDQLEKEFAQYFDQMLSDNIAGILSELDGTAYTRGTDPDTEEEKTESSKIAQWKINEENSIDAARRPPEEEVETSEIEHALSDDELPEEVKSLAESVDDDIMPPEFQAPQAGGNAEAFLDAALAKSTTGSKAQQTVNIGGVTGKLQYAGKGFSPQRPRATIAEFTGDE